MSASEDEAQDLDAGWDDADSDAAAADAVASSEQPATEEVDSGWDDVPEGVPGAAPTLSGGKRRPHRERRAKSGSVSLSSNPVLAPRPAEPTKKQHRDHARQQRAHELRVRQERKAERKAERAAQAREDAAERARRAEAEEQARRARQEARERARSDRPAPSKPASTKKSTTGAKSKARPAELKRRDSDAPSKSSRPPKQGPRYGVLITLGLLAIVAALLLLKK